MTQFDKRLIPNYIIAAAIIGTFLWAIGYTLVNIDNILSIVGTDDPKQNFIMGAVVSALFTALIFIVKEVTTYLFRKNPSPTPEPETIV